MSRQTGWLFAALAVLAACPAPPTDSPSDTDTGIVSDTSTDTDSGSTSDTDSGSTSETDSGSTSDTDSGSTADTDCTPEGEPLLGEARIVCAAGTLESSGACTATEAASTRQTLTCEDYASSGQQQLELEVAACAAEAGAECCTCSFELDASCDPCEVND